MRFTATGSTARSVPDTPLKHCVGEGRPQSPIEELLARALDERGIDYRCQYVAQYRFYPARCRSKYPCRCGISKYANGEVWDEYEYERWGNGDRYMRGDDVACDWITHGVAHPRYILDFAILDEGLFSGLAIECDGKAWHEGREWFDRHRQDSVEKGGFWEFLRFTGAEITADPAACAAKIAEWIEEQRLADAGTPSEAWIAKYVREEDR